MTKEDFHIGVEFYTGAGKWRCTDIGTRVIVAIKLDQTDESWYNGPPYAVAESVLMSTICLAVALIRRSSIQIEPKERWR
jgi:hypothetical protein